MLAIAGLHAALSFYVLLLNLPRAFKRQGLPRDTSDAVWNAFNCLIYLPLSLLPETARPREFKVALEINGLFWGLLLVTVWTRWRRRRLSRVPATNTLPPMPRSRH